MKPNFLIAGSAKTGTTSLRIYLDRHPDIYCHHKEIHYFDDNYDKGNVWYENHFKGITRQAIGEKTPSYFYFHPSQIPKRVYNYNPKMKLIFTLRNPIYRAWSHYLMHQFNGYNKQSFMDTMLTEKDYGIPDFNKQYLNAGNYIKNIQNWCEYFPKDQMCFSIIEEMDNNELNRICSFLGLYNFDFGMLERYNVGGKRRSKLLSKLILLIPDSFKYKFSILRGLNLNKSKYPQMLDEDKKFLVRYYQPLNKQLEKFTGLNLERWDII